LTEERTIDDIMEIAIQREQEAADFYNDLSHRAAFAAMKETFHEFAKEELRHKAKLMNVKKGGGLTSSNETIPDLKIGDYLRSQEVGPDLDYQGALIVAMKREKAAFRLYSGLAEIATDPLIKELFLGLAQEEAKHKLKFEIEYDEVILKDN